MEHPFIFITDIEGAKERARVAIRDLVVRVLRRDLRDLDLAGADLSDLDLGSFDLRKANLTGANLVDTKLVGARLERTDLRGVIGLIPEGQCHAYAERSGAIVDD